MEKAEKNLELITRYFGEFTGQQLQQFSALDDLYGSWNSKINVISRKDMDSLYEKHVLHSLSIAAACEFAPGTTVVDLGTGGGFPGIPLAIFFPEVQFHLVDSIGKKIKVVQDVAASLNLTNLTAQHTRIEDIKGRQFDFIVSRAVAPLADLWRWSKPLLRKKTDHAPLSSAFPALAAGGLICLKGGDLVQEIADSHCRPSVLEVYKLFPEEFFRNKYILCVSPK